MNKGKEVTFCYEKIDQVDSVSSLGSIMSKGEGCTEDTKSRITTTQGNFITGE